ncbi:hypothetical protein D3C81_1964140 [compost metagenome]
MNIPIPAETPDPNIDDPTLPPEVPDEEPDELPVKPTVPPTVGDPPSDEPPVGADLSAMGRSAAPNVGPATQSIADESAPTPLGFSGCRALRY